MIIFCIPVLVSVVLLVKWLAGESSTGTGLHDKSPLEILRPRYAGHEIDCEAYEQKRSDLKPPS